jgi:outer membrane protein assembly factor BamB
VYFGSYDGTFYALDARSGDTRWTFDDGGKISGAATVVGGVVYYSNWGKRNTAGLDIRTGKKVWSNERGAFNPVVANEDEIYLTGFSSVAALQPRALYKRERAQARKRKQARKRAQAQKRAEQREQDSRD